MIGAGDREWDALPESTKQHLGDYGFRQYVNDGPAPVKRTDFKSDEAYMAACGEAVRKRHFSRTDPEVAEAKRQVAEIKKLGITAAEWQMLREHLAKEREAA